MQPAEQLRKALELFGPNGEHWTKGEYAKDATGKPVSPTSPDAVCWCSLGAIRKVGLSWVGPESFLTSSLTTNQVIWEWQDEPERTFSEVRAVFEKAIDAATEAQ